MKDQLYMQRFVQRFRAAGEVVIFNRSWYNCPGFEHGTGYCAEDQCERFLDVCPADDQATLAGNTFVPRSF